MFIERIDIDVPDGMADLWPYDLPAVAQIVAEGLKLTSPVTFLVGENGAGKSTLMEAVAEAWGIDPKGGRGKRRPRPEPGTLAASIDLGFSPAGARLHSGRGRSSSYFLRAESALGLLEYVSGFDTIVPGYPQEDLRTLSHGEGYLALFREVFSRPGLYLMDEPESALSFLSSLDLVVALAQAAENGAQVICATHSPILASTPGAAILELDDDGIHPVEWEDLDIVQHWRRYLNDPRSFLRHLLP